MTFEVVYGTADTAASLYYLNNNNPLKSAIRIALQLGKPLLLTGEPGTGKTQLAHWAAWYLNQDKEKEHPIPFLDKPFVFNTKTYSSGKDILYHYDAISHFQNQNQNKKTESFISLTAFGKAILQTWGRHEIETKFTLSDLKNIEEIKQEAKSSVVLIDEIDKAPRDFPNDLLNEIDTNSFYITELDKKIKRDVENESRILVILTSNEEKNLPDAFLRRCIYFNIPFPDEKELKEIIKSRLSPFFEATKEDNIDDKYASALNLFKLARSSAANKPPATSELLDWIKVLQLYDILGSDFKNIQAWDMTSKEALKLSLHTLFKNKNDLEVFRQQIFGN